MFFVLDNYASVILCQLLDFTNMTSIVVQNYNKFISAVNAIAALSISFVYFQTIDWMVQEEKNLFAPHYAGYLGSSLDEAKKLQEKVVKFSPTCKVKKPNRHFVVL